MAEEVLRLRDYMLRMGVPEEDEVNLCAFEESINK